LDLNKFLILFLSILVTILFGSIFEADAASDVIVGKRTVTSLTINSTDILQVNSGATLIITSKIQNNGLIINMGTIENRGVFTNNSILTNDLGAFFSNAVGASIDNFGSFTNKGTIENEGVFSNDGVIGNSFDGIINILENGSFDNDLDGIITNEGTIVNFGSIINDGTIGNFGGTIANEGLILNNLGDIANDGVISNSSVANFTNVGSITLGETISDLEAGTITNECGSFFNNVGSIVDNTIIDLCNVDTDEAVPVSESEKDDDSSRTILPPKSKKDDDSPSIIPTPVPECETGLVFKDVECVKETDSGFQVNERVPEWVKTNAGWWADDQIEDSEFISGIEFLINENIIVIQNVSVQDTNEIEDVPEWFRNNSSWWALDLISEDEFLNAIKFLIEEGIIKIKT